MGEARRLPGANAISTRFFFFNIQPTANAGERDSLEILGKRREGRQRRVRPSRFRAQRKFGLKSIYM